jgi:hypothetical protein
VETIKKQNMISEDKEPKPLRDFIMPIGQKIMELYWTPLYKYLQKHPQLIKTFPAFLLKYEKLVLYFGKTHLAIEYYGPERVEELNSNGVVELTYHDYTQSNDNFLEQIIGFEYDSTTNFEMPLAPYFEDLILPTNKGFEKLQELKWNFAAQSSIMALNSGKFYIPKGEFSRMVNSLFFDANDTGLKTRHIKWIDFIPLDYDDSGEKSDSLAINFSVYTKELFEHDANFVYPLPDDNDFLYSKLPKINRFIEQIGNESTTEPQITAFLSVENYRFILSMAFLATDIFHQLICKWQNEDRKDIQPDFFVLRANGFADIVEFKLPKLKTKTTTGRENREAFSAEINSYIAQTRIYKEYFNDPANRKWFENEYGFKVLKPRRILVVGRRWDFDNDEWKEIISDYIDVEIMNYDELIDGVTAQFYK